jgi:cytochrome c oxidase subunit 2
MIVRNSSLIAPKGRWWSPLGRDERLWVLVTVVWALSMFVMMQLIWPRIGQQNVDISTFRVDPAEYGRIVTEFVDANQVDERGGIPVVEAEPGDVYLQASRYQFRPILRLKRGQSYNLHLSSLDVQHGFSLQPDNINLQVLPGYVTRIKITPKETGDYVIVCNEYCGTGHHIMLGGIEVIE